MGWIIHIRIILSYQALFVWLNFQLDKSELGERKREVILTQRHSSFLRQPHWRTSNWHGDWYVFFLISAPAYITFKNGQKCGLTYSVDRCGEITGGRSVALMRSSHVCCVAYHFMNASSPSPGSLLFLYIFSVWVTVKWLDFVLDWIGVFLLDVLINNQSGRRQCYFYVACSYQFFSKFVNRTRIAILIKVIWETVN